MRQEGLGGEFVSITNFCFQVHAFCKKTKTKPNKNQNQVVVCRDNINKYLKDFSFGCFV